MNTIHELENELDSLADELDLAQQEVAALRHDGYPTGIWVAEVKRLIGKRDQLAWDINKLDW